MAFHDFILGQGLLPLDILRMAVLEEFAPAHAMAPNLADE
jgi:hypothetical protein